MLLQMAKLHSFYGRVVFHCMYVPQLLCPFSCRRASRLLLCPHWCRQCSGERWGTCVFVKYGFLRIYDQLWDFWVIWIRLLLDVRKDKKERRVLANTKSKPIYSQGKQGTLRGVKYLPRLG